MQQLRKVFLFCVFGTLIHYITAQETFPVNGVFNKNHNYYAFTNARIYTDFETIIENGTLLIKDGEIVEVGDKVTLPKGTLTYDLKGKNIYPSLIDIYTGYGLPEVKKAARNRSQPPQYESSTKGAYNWNQAIKAEFDAFRSFVHDKKAAEEYRKLGFGIVLTLQKDGIARGSAAIVGLGEENENESVIVDKAAACYSFDKGSSSQQYPSSLMGSIALIRQTYLDAQWYKENQKKTEFNASLDAWNKLLALPQFFEVKDKLSALRAAKIGKEFSTQYIIKGAGDEYQRLEDIKETHCRFILPLNFPNAYNVDDPYDAMNISMEELKHWEMAPANPSFFEKKSIEFALTAADLKDKNDFWKNLRKAIDHGLSEKQALKALTVTPAEMLGISAKAGRLKKGMLAGFIITSGNLFDAKTKIHENWIKGNQYIINDYNVTDLNGNYDLKVGPDKQYSMKIKGEPGDFKGILSAANDTNKTTAIIKADHNAISISFIPGSQKETIRLSGVIDEKKFFTGGLSPEGRIILRGRGELNTGEWVDWTATYKSDLKEPAKKDTAQKEKPTIGEVYYPFCAYGEPDKDRTFAQQLRERQHAILIKNVTVWTNDSTGVLKNKDVYINSGHIVAIDDAIKPLKTANAVEIDGTGKHLTAGIIDEHSHIAVSGNVNEAAQSVTAEVRIGDVVNSDDINIYRQLAGGVTASQLLHGSANPVGGQSALIKLRWGQSPEKMKIENADGFIKFALGENVKQSNWGDGFNTRFPQTRMGVEQVYYDVFTRAKEYDERIKKYNALSKNEKTLTQPPRKDIELDAILEILNKKRFVTCHSYVQSEINMLMHVADSMGFKVNTFTHILEGYKVADKMKAHGAGGSTFADWWAYKMEVKDAIPYNAAILSKMGIVTAINSDDAEMGRRLNQESAKAIKYGGLSEEDALKLCTLNPAKLLHLDKKVGYVKVGYDADVVLWSDNPLSVNTKAEKTIIDGIIYYDIDKDKKLRDDMQKERTRLIQKMIAAKKNGEKTQRAESKQQKMKHCDDFEEEESY
ncbi:MAG: amidohydrolase family protein [Bacteroidetes bacterium]|nr:amidohydrolase family protein [Bacteroidota bacterium]